jgi:ribosomal protein S6--L-glutamate ligase
MVIGVLCALKKGLAAGSNQRLVRAITDLGHTPVPMHLGSFTVVWRDGQPVYEGDVRPEVVISRPTNVREPTLFTYALSSLEALKIPLLNKSVPVLLTKNKLHQITALAAAGVRVPDFACVDSTELALSSAEQFGYPVVIKVSFGIHGKGVFLMRDREALAQTADYLLVRDKNPIIIQKYLPEVAALGDLRVLVVAGEVVGVMSKKPQAQEWRTNVAQGSEIKADSLSKAEERAVLQAVQALGLDVAGVDAVRTSSGLVILEVNSCPGYVGLESVVAVDVSAKIVQAAINLGHCGQRLESLN